MESKNVDKFENGVEVENYSESPKCFKSRKILMISKNVANAKNCNKSRKIFTKFKNIQKEKY